jgi:hypothetical protein
MKCDCCGVESPVEQAFRPVVRVFQQPLRYCPPCAKKRNWVLNKRSLMVLAVCAILLLLMGFGLERPGPKRNELLFLPLCIAFYPLCVVLHELAHAAVAKACGLRVFGVCIGLSGPTVWKRTVWGTEIQIKWLPFEGLTLVAPRSLRLYRLRFALSVAAGPLTNGLLALGAYHFVHASSNVVIGPFVWANLFIVAITLLPWRHATPRGIVSSDGLAILSAPFTSERVIKDRHAAYFALEGLQRVQSKNYQAAIDWTQMGLREYPGDKVSRSVLGLAQLGLNQFDAARATFIAGLEAAGTDLSHRAIFLNNIAWTDLSMEDLTRLEEADRYSEEAMHLLPWVSIIRGTRGSVLVELGRLEEGISLLTAGNDQSEDPRSQATSECFLAIGRARQGNRDQGRGHLERARKLDPDCSVIPRAQREFSESEVHQ